MSFSCHNNSVKPKVAVFCTTFLPYSQTFVWDELRSHQRYAAEVFAWRRKNEQLFPGKIRVARAWYPLTRRDAHFDRALIDGRHSVIHAHFGWAGAIACRFARRHALPLIVTFHGYDVALLARGGLGPVHVWPFTLRIHEMLEQMTLGLCASEDLVDLLVGAGVPRGRLREHRLGVDLERFRPGLRDPDALRVVMVGRLVEKKGFGDGLRAFARLLAQHPHATLDIVGSGPREAELRGLMDSLGLRERARLRGALPHSDVAALLSRSDVLLAPSMVGHDGDRDSGLLSAKEASAAGCVPVATRHGGIPAIIDDGETGFLVPERDIGAIAERLVQLARSPDRRAAMAAAARTKMVRQYGLRDSVQRLEEYYDEAIRRHKPSAKFPAGNPVAPPSKE